MALKLATMRRRAESIEAKAQIKRNQAIKLTLVKMIAIAAPIALCVVYPSALLGALLRGVMILMVFGVVVAGFCNRDLLLRPILAAVTCLCLNEVIALQVFDALEHPSLHPITFVATRAYAASDFDPWFDMRIYCDIYLSLSSLILAASVYFLVAHFHRNGSPARVSELDGGQ